MKKTLWLIPAVLILLTPVIGFTFDPRTETDYDLKGAVFSSTATSQVTSTTTATSMIPAGSGSVTIQSNAWNIGKTYHVIAWGDISTTDASSGALNIDFNVGSTAVATSGNLNLVDNIASRIWKLDLLLTCWTIGASGTMMANGTFDIATTVGSTYQVWDLKSTAPVTIPTTGALALGVKATFSVDDDANILKTNNFVIEALN